MRRRPPVDDIYADKNTSVTRVFSIHRRSPLRLSTKLSLIPQAFRSFSEKFGLWKYWTTPILSSCFRYFPWSIETDPFLPIKAANRRRKKVVNAAGENEWEKESEREKKQAGPGNDASGLSLCVYWSFGVYEMTDGRTNGWKDWVVKEALKSCWLIICFSRGSYRG